MKSRPYPIPYPADSGIDSGPAVGHQQQAVREDIPRIGFPEGVEQETAQYSNEADIDIEVVRTKAVRTRPVCSAPCGMPHDWVCSAPCGMLRHSVCSAPVHVSGSPGFPALLKTVDTEYQHAQI